MSPARLLILCGLALIALGLLLSLTGRLPWLGRLPGDIRIEREQVSFYFTLGTCLLLSLLGSLLFWLFRR